MRSAFILLLPCADRRQWLAPTQQGRLTADAPGIASASASDTLPIEAFTGSPLDQDTLPGIIPKHMQPPGYEPVRQHGPPMPAQVYGSWKPPGIAMPWPEEEFLFDGGDTAPGVVVRQDWRVDGLNVEDTVAHFDTLDGRTLVTPSNRVCLYAPRFASVRRVDNLIAGEQHERAGRASQNLGWCVLTSACPSGNTCSRSNQSAKRAAIA